MHPLQVFEEHRQRFAGECLQRLVLPGADLPLEQLHRLLMLHPLPAHVGFVEVVPVASGEFVGDRAALFIQRVRHGKACRACRRGELRVRIGVVNDHALAERTHAGDASDPSRSVVTANELHLPVGRVAEIELQTLDVIHSLWIPGLSGKQDLVPGRTNHLRVTPRRTGRLRGQCAEFCGLQHAWMALDVRIDDEAGFAAWREHQLRDAAPPASDDARAGAAAFAAVACPLCHAIRGSTAAARTGPDLTHLASRSTLAAGALPFSRATLLAWLADPQRHKPGAHMPRVPLDEARRERIVDYLMTLD